MRKDVVVRTQEAELTFLAGAGRNVGGQAAFGLPVAIFEQLQWRSWRPVAHVTNLTVRFRFISIRLIAQRLPAYSPFAVADFPARK